MENDNQPLPYVCGDESCRGLCREGCGRQNKQLNTYDYMADIPGNADVTDLVEVQFKNTRKGYYHNSNGLELHKGDIVAVESLPGYDVGVVTLTGRLVELQVRKANLKSPDDIKRVYRLAKESDIEKWNEAKSREHDTMIQSRQIAKDLGLDMKIGDVEYQGDGNKAIFYYIADERVDFRQLIKVLAETFHVRIEMRQIGARQEAGRIGGTGPCGRELCCATWVRNFSSVSTNAARHQDISLNPQKLAGMCAKLKCCLNYEVDTYMEASQGLPTRDIVLQTADADFYLFKTDILAGLVSYSTDKRVPAHLTTITAVRAREIIELNKQGIKPESLEAGHADTEQRDAKDIIADSDLSRFDRTKKKKKHGAKPQADNAAPAEAPQPQQKAQVAEPQAQQKAEKQSKPKSKQAKQAKENKPKQPKNGQQQSKEKPRAAQAEGRKKQGEEPKQQAETPKQQ